jgi:uncharacterized membrane protein
MSGYFADWLALLLRWGHVVTGIAWIGASFYFVWLDNSLEPLTATPGGEEAGIAGELWAVHGGGFYRARKYRVAPPQLPATLHWFYWEAYTTWLTGFALLCVLYFRDADAYLVDAAVRALTPAQAIGAALLSLCGSWLVYDALCRSPLAGQPRLLGGVIALLTGALAYALCGAFGGRGAYMVYGATLGTIMVANVLFVIIPGQRELVRAKRDGREPDPAPGLRGKQRSVHNTYFTLPVLFVMLSQHYPMTFGARANWLVLVAMSAAGASLRAWFVFRHKPALRTPLVRAVPAALGIALLAGVIVALTPGAPLRNRAAASGAAMADGAAEGRVAIIVAGRCAPCHAEHPTQAGFGTAPNGLMLQTPEQLLTHAAAAEVQLTAQAMPLGNLTGMTPEERTLLLGWLQAHSRR